MGCAKLSRPLHRAQRADITCPGWGAGRAVFGAWPTVSQGAAGSKQHKYAEVAKCQDTRQTPRGWPAPPSTCRCRSCQSQLPWRCEAAERISAWDGSRASASVSAPFWQAHQCRLPYGKRISVGSIMASASVSTPFWQVHQCWLPSGKPTSAAAGQLPLGRVAWCCNLAGSQGAAPHNAHG